MMIAFFKPFLFKFFKEFIREKILIALFFFNLNSVISQNYENVYYQIDVTANIVGRKILHGDTLLVLAKKAGTKYVDSLKLHTLDNSIYYYFKLPDSLPNGKYCAYYNDKKQNICFIVNYQKSKKNGSFKMFHYNQSLREIGYYNENCYDKVRVEYNKKGYVMGVYNYSNCELNGSSTTFYSTGEFNNIVNYKNGKKDGQFIQYNYDKKKFPNVIYDFEYKDGVLIKKH